ncbi:MAG: radical SAM protein [Proteobacteria bacterium]|nr:radical SAM protein [Pseudomonadota bacterium]
MKNYEYALSITSQFYFCGIPFRLDTKPKCALNCLYCFAMARGGRRTYQPLLANVPSIYKRLSETFAEVPKIGSINSELLSRRVPVHFGGMSEPFSDEQSTKVSLQLLRILNDFHYPIVLSTKNSHELMKDETLNELKKLQHLVVQISIMTSNETLANIIEPNVPPTTHRLKTVRILRDEGIDVIVRLQPLLINLLDEMEHELIPMIGAAGSRHVVVEFLKLPIEKNVSLFREMCQKTNTDYYELYHRNKASRIGREWLLPNDFRWQKLQPIIAAIHMQEMTYGAADYGLYHLGDTDCCCGIDDVHGFGNWFSGNISNVLRQRQSDHIYFDDLCKHWFPVKSIKRYMNSKCRLESDNTTLGLLKSKWNRPGTTNAPDSYLGVKWKGDYDNSGNAVYVIKKEPKNARRYRRGKAKSRTGTAKTRRAF